jgi:anti-sigma-K factor RskA
LAQGITLAVTREIAGGSPTGAPQGPIVAAGPLATI